MDQQIRLLNFQENTPMVKIETEASRLSGVHLWLKREDLIHPDLSGNKWRKLKYNLVEAKKSKKQTLLTFGGAYSNHIAAVAEAGKLFNFETIGVIRGETPPKLGHTLRQAAARGMRLIYVTRSAYRSKSTLLEQLKVDLSETYVIPEGGTNLLALKGCREITQEQESPALDYWCVACGTGGTAAGMISGLSAQQQLIGFAMLKGDFMEGEIRSLLTTAGCSKTNWSINGDYHFGGYAKFTPALIEFINMFKKKYDIPLDPIYTGKLLYGVLDLVEKGYFATGTSIGIVHTGGQQGILGFRERFGAII